MTRSLPEARNAGFSLIELAIVTVIIGLLVGGIIGGREIIKSSQIQKMITDLASYESAFQQFKLKYSYLPGDFPTATTFWPDATNGNGDEQMNQNTEGVAAWYHLSASRILEKPFTSTCCAFDPGVNMPELALRQAFITTLYTTAHTGTTSAAACNIVGNGFQISPGAGAYNGPVLKPLEALIMDTKMDDGHPDQGRFCASSTNCRIGTYPNATYNTTFDAIGCHAVWFLSFQ